MGVTWSRSHVRAHLQADPGPGQPGGGPGKVLTSRTRRAGNRRRAGRRGRRSAAAGPGSPPPQHVGPAPALPPDGGDAGAGRRARQASPAERRGASPIGGDGCASEAGPTQPAARSVSVSHGAAAQSRCWGGGARGAGARLSRPWERGPAAETTEAEATRSQGRRRGTPEPPGMFSECGARGHGGPGRGREPSARGRRGRDGGGARAAARGEA